MALITVEKREHAAVLGFNRADKRNALDAEIVGELERALLAIATEPAVLVLRSTTPGMFVAGSDLRELRDRGADDGLLARLARVLDRLAAHRWPTIALVDGPALGGGCEVALACDFRLASPSASFGQPETGFGILAAAGGNWRLRELVGLPVARRMLLAGEIFPADAALAAGLVDSVHPSDELLDAGLAMAERISRRSVRATELTKLALGLNTRSSATFDQAAQALLYELDEKSDRITTFLNRRHSGTPHA